jgi:hypothetical protein
MITKQNEAGESLEDNKINNEKKRKVPGKEESKVKKLRMVGIKTIKKE